MARWVSCILAVAVLAACSGGGSNVLPGAAKTGSPSSKARVQVAIAMHVPGAASARTAKLRRIYTVAQSTEGAQVAVYPAGNDTGTPLATTVANIEPSTSPGSTCAASDQYGNRSCSFFVSAPAGADDFVITTWNQPPSAGAVAGQQLGWGADYSVQVAAGATPPPSCSPTVASVCVNVTLSSVLSSVALDVTPAVFHQVIPSTGTIGIYALDASDDVIVSNGWVDPDGNAITLSLSMDNTLNGTLNLSTSSLSAPSPNGVLYQYEPSNGVLGTTGNSTTNITLSSSYSAVANASAVLTGIYPTFTSISDGNLNVNNPYHGGIAFDTSGGVYYTTTANFGGISYYPGSGSAVENYAASSAQPVHGSIVNGAGTLYAIAGNAEFTFAAPPSSTFAAGPNSTLAPVPNGSAVAYDATHGGFWYTSGSELAFYPASSGSPTTTGLGVDTNGGVAVDASANVWVVDNINNRLIEYPGGNNPLQSGGSAFDVLANSTGIWVTDHGPNPAILQANSGGLTEVYSVPDGAVPWYVMADNAQPGIIWFDYLQNGQIGIGRMDTNVSPATYVMATDVNGPYGSQAGAIGAASNGLVYMVFDNTSTLVQVSR